MALDEERWRLIQGAAASHSLSKTRVDLLYQIAPYLSLRRLRKFIGVATKGGNKLYWEVQRELTALTRKGGMRYYFLIFLVLGVGCGSRNLQKEHSVISNKIYALQEEVKALTNMEMVVREQIRQEENFEKQSIKYLKVREENDKQGFPLGPNFSTGGTYAETLARIAEAVRELELEVDKLHKQRVDIDKLQMQ